MERTKTCQRCTEDKPWSQFHAKTRWDDGSVRTVQSYCKLCAVAKQRERMGHSPRSQQTREQRLAKKRKAYWANADVNRQKKREFYDRMKKDPTWLARKRESDRLAAWSLRRRRGMQESPHLIGRQRAGQVTEHEITRLPVEPFAKWLEQLHEELGGVQEVAFATGMDERRVRCVIGREYERVSIDVVDRATLNEGHYRIDDVYGWES